MSKVTATILITAGVVVIVVAVLAILGPRLLALAERTGDQIDDAPLMWGEPHPAPLEWQPPVWQPAGP